MRTRCASEVSIGTSINHMEEALTESKENSLYTSPESSVSLDDTEADSFITAEVERIFMELFQSDLSLFTDNSELKFGQLVSGDCGHTDYFDTDIITRRGEAQEKNKDNETKFARSNSRYSLKGFQLFKTIKRAAPSLSRSNSINPKATEDTFTDQEETKLDQPITDIHGQTSSADVSEIHKEAKENASNDGSGMVQFRKRSNTFDSIFETSACTSHMISRKDGKSPNNPSTKNLNRYNSLTAIPTNSSLNCVSQQKSTSGSSSSSTARILKPSLSLSSKSTRSFPSFRSFTSTASDENLSRSSSQRYQLSSGSRSTQASVSPAYDKSKSMDMTRNRVFVPLDIPKNLGDFSASSILNELGIEDKEVKRSQSLNSPLKTPETRFLRKNSSSVDLPLINWDKTETHKSSTLTAQREFTFSRLMSPTIRPHCTETRYFVAEEILTTEITYLENLEIILNTFMVPIQDMAKTSDPIVRPHDTKIIFQGIEPLYKLSQELCYELKYEIEHWNANSRIGRLFLKHQRSWDIYPRFVDNYSFAREAIQRAEGTTSFSEFIKNVAKNDTKRQTLKEFLIIPIQRVTRYTLLLKDLQKQTREDHPDYGEVTQALKFMKNLAVRVNEVKQKEEERTRLFTIFNSIRNCPPTMINSKRRFMLETDVLETRSNRRLHVVLYSDYLMLATSGKSRQLKTGEKWVFLRLIDLRHIILFNVPDTKDATNLTVIFVSNPIPASNPDSMESVGSRASLLVNTADSSSSSPPSSPRSPSRTSFVESRKRSFSKKQASTNQYVFQHFDHKSKVEFLIALESELSKISKGLGGQARNFIQTFSQPEPNTF